MSRAIWKSPGAGANSNDMTYAVIRATDMGLLAAVRRHCELYHYLRRYPDPRSLPFGYALVVDDELHATDGRLYGLLVFKKPQHHKQRHLFGYPGLPTAWQVLDLARVWIHPCLQQPGRNVFSQMVALALRRVQRDWLDHHPPRFPARPYHIRLIISYADLRHHAGTAYRASNFKLWGVQHNKALYVRHLKQPVWQWQQTGLIAQYPLLPDMPIFYPHITSGE